MLRSPAARLYKDQALSERAHHFLKGPVAVRPVFLQSNRRAAALVGVCSIALLVYGLIESELRDAIGPARTIPGLLPEGRAARPTAENVFRAFNGLGYQRARTTDGLEKIPDPLTTAQRSVLTALGIPSILPPRGHP
jgi:transposase